jgi:hypothetical protein
VFDLVDQIRRRFADVRDSALHSLQRPVIACIVAILIALSSLLVASCSLVPDNPFSAIVTGSPSPPSSPVREQPAMATSVPVSGRALLVLSAVQIPSWPIEARQHVDLSVTVANRYARSVENVTVELTVTDPVGSDVLDVRQANLLLQANDSKVLDWQWRVPDYPATGLYTVTVRSYDAAGKTLIDDDPVRAILHVVAPSAFVRSTGTGSRAAEVSPYMCGVNIDPRLAEELDAAKAIGVTTIRFGPDANYSTYLGAVKKAGLQPMIILRGVSVADAAQRLALNKQLVREAQGVFGLNTRLFYEVGNENDLEAGLGPNDYTTMWNGMIADLKQIAPNSWFGGPVNYQANPQYTATFVHSAAPKPDFIAWHEYTCPSAMAGAECVQHIENWTSHIANIRDAIKANNDPVPPMMVTEWNYAPDGGVSTDDKHADPAFMSNWTTTALQTLIDGNVYGAYQFNVSNALPLMGSPQGEVFQRVCRPVAGTEAGPAPTPVAATVTLANSPSQPGAVFRAPGSILAQDPFQRPDQTYWGSPGGGLVWGGDANTAPPFTIRGNTGVIAGGDGPYDAILGPPIADTEVRFTGSLSSFLDSNIGAVLRWNDTNNWYKAYIDGTNLVLQKRVGGSYTVLGAAPFAATPNVSYSLRFQVVGATLIAKVWPTNRPEPEDSMVTATDSEVRLGRPGLRAQISGGARATYASFASYELTSVTPTPALSSLVTITQTPTPDAVSVASTPVATAVKQATVVPSAGASEDAIVGVYALNVHRGPALDYPVFASVQYGQRYRVTGQTSSGDWVALCCVRGQSGWVLSNLVRRVDPNISSQ